MIGELQSFFMDRTRRSDIGEGSVLAIQYRGLARHGLKPRKGHITIARINLQQLGQTIRRADAAKFAVPFSLRLRLTLRCTTNKRHEILHYA
jgi:hypothetical protein